jgi:hypothetical protein
LIRRHLLAALAAATAAALLAGCGASSSGATPTANATNDSSAAPKTELTDAVHSLTAGSALTTTLTLDTTAANLLKIAGPQGDLAPSDADLIANARLVVESVAPDGKTLQEATAAGDTNVSITGSTGDTTYFTLLDVNKTLYFQIDLKNLIAVAESHDGESTTYQRIVGQAAHLPEFAQAIVAGKWVSLPLSTVTSLEALISGFSQGAASSPPIPTASQIRSLVEQLAVAVVPHLTVTRTSTGATDQFVVTGNVRTIAHDILTTTAAAVPALASKINPDAANQAPDKNVKLDAAVTDGALSRLEVDVGQFSPQQKDTLPVAATFAKTAALISTPSDAVPISLADLVSFFTAAGSSSSEGATESRVSPVPSEVPMTTSPSSR